LEQKYDTSQLPCQLLNRSQFICDTPTTNESENGRLSEVITSSIPVSIQPTVNDEDKTLLTHMAEISERFLKLNKPYTQKAIHQLQGFYVNKSSQIECNRYSSLRAAGDKISLRRSINIKYDEEHRTLIDRVERSISLLEKKVEKLFHEKTKRSTSSTSKVSQVAIEIMRNWYDRNSEHPYPGYETAEVMAKAGNISVDQVKKWFSNRRQRFGNTKAISEIARRRKRRRTLSGDDILLESAKLARIQ
jgi:hypothetical protein